MTTFVPYKVDHAVKNTAKTFGFAKKRVNFKFGFASLEALDQGETGAGCRGSEHEVVFIWSLATGKRQLYVDGKDVHFSESGMNGWTNDRTWQHSFPLRDMATGNSYKVLFISQVATPDIPDSHPFDLRINGLSYYRFNEIWKLGSPQMVARDLNSTYASRKNIYKEQDDPSSGLNPEEQRQIAMAKLASMKDMQQKEEDAKRQSMAAAPASARHVFNAPPPVARAPASARDLLAPPNQVIVPSPYGQPPVQQLQQQNSGTDFYGGAIVPAPTSAYGAPAPYPGAPPAPSMQMTPYAGAPGPYGGYAPAPVTAPGAPAPSQQFGNTAGYGGSTFPSTPTNNGTTAPAFASPGGQTVYTYGSAPAFAKPASEKAPAGAGYAQQPPAFAQPQQHQQPPTQQQNPFGGF